MSFLCLQIFFIRKIAIFAIEIDAENYYLGLNVKHEIAD